MGHGNREVTRNEGGSSRKRSEGWCAEEMGRDRAAFLKSVVEAGPELPALCRGV